MRISVPELVFGKGQTLLLADRSKKDRDDQSHFGKKTVLLEDEERALLRFHGSPDDCWTSLYPRRHNSEGQILIAPFRDEAPIARETWIAVTDGMRLYYAPEWSPDGNRLYYVFRRRRTFAYRHAKTRPLYEESHWSP